MQAIKRTVQFLIIAAVTWVLLEGSAFLGIWMLARSTPQTDANWHPLNALVRNFHPLFSDRYLDIPPYLKKGPDAVYGPSTRTGNRYRPNRTYDAKLVTGDEAFICNEVCKPIPLDKPAGEFRIFVLGGSSVAGHGVETGAQTIPALLERQLNASGKFLGKTVRVINAGVGGHFSGQEMVTLANRIIPLQPDMILTYNGYNDLLQFTWMHFSPAGARQRARFELNLSHYDYELLGGFDSIQTVPGALTQLAAAFNSEIPILYYAYNLATYLAKPGNAAPAAARPSEAQIQEWARARGQNSAAAFVANVDIMAGLARGLGIPAVLCLQPTLLFTPQGRPSKDNLVGGEANGMDAIKAMTEYNVYYGHAAEQFRRRVRENSGPVRYCDMTEMFRPTAEQVFVDPVHLNARGNELVAERFAREISGLLAAK